MRLFGRHPAYRLIDSQNIQFRSKLFGNLFYAGDGLSDRFFGLRLIDETIVTANPLALLSADGKTRAEHCLIANLMVVEKALTMSIPENSPRCTDRLTPEPTNGTTWPPANAVINNLQLELLRFQFRAANDLKCLSPSSYGFAARSVNEVGQLVGAFSRRRQSYVTELAVNVWKQPRLKLLGH